MLQYIPSQHPDYSIAEQVQMALEAGCRWIQLHTGDMDDAQIRELAAEVVPLCQEIDGQVFLTLENNGDLARELGIHGVHITDKNISAPDMRDRLGAEAVIGVETDNPQAILALKGADIDYATLAAALTPDQCRAIIADAKAASNRMPVVMHANTPEAASAAFSAGANGIVADSSVMDATDPVEALSALLQCTQNK